MGVEGVTFAARDELVSILEYDLVLSNYAFSEFRRDVQENYSAEAPRRAARGYATCNWITPSGFQAYGRDELLAAVPDSAFYR